ncbi:MAG: hypothetical protein NXI32_14085 [bacterium]|nr:hypothetical protein [bacterium]
MSESPQPSWSELFRPENRACPSWYHRHLLDESREFWDGRMGSGFYDWYLEEVIEGAEAHPRTAAATRLTPSPHLRSPASYISLAFDNAMR